MAEIKWDSSNNTITMAIINSLQHLNQEEITKLSFANTFSKGTAPTVLSVPLHMDNKNSKKNQQTRQTYLVLDSNSINLNIQVVITIQVNNT